MDKADFIEVLSQILPSQDSNDWESILRNSPEIYKILLVEFQTDVIEEVRRQATY